MTLDEKIRSLQSNIEEMQERKTKLVQETRALLDAEKPSDDDIKNADAKAKEVKDLNIEIKSGNETLASYKAVANDEPEGPHPPRCSRPGCAGPRCRDASAPSSSWAVRSAEFGCV